MLFDHYGKPGHPWKIVVHFQAFPVHLLLKCTNPEESEHFYFHSLKQALFQLHGTTRLFNELSVEQQRILWKSIQQGDRASYHAIAESLRPAPLLNSTVPSSAISELKMIPIRLCQLDQPVVQRPVRIWRTYDAPAALNTDGEQKYMRLLDEVLSQDFAEVYNSRGGREHVQCIVQGIEVPLNAPIYDLWHLMSHCDLYLYVTLRSRSR